MVRIIFLLMSAAVVAACGAGTPPIITVVVKVSATPAPTATPLAEQRRIAIPGASVLSLSPDGTRFAVFDDFDLCLYDVSTLSQQSCAQAGRSSAASVTWSSNGQYVAFVAQDTGGAQRSHVYVMRAEDGEVTRLGDDALILFWSPDSKSLAVAMDSPVGFGVFRLPIEGGEPVLVRPDLPGNLMPRGSSGEFLYSAGSTLPDEAGVWLINPGELGVRRIIGPDAKLGRPLLVEVSVDGSKALVLYLAGFRQSPLPGTSPIALVDIASGETTLLMPEAGPSLGPRDAAFSPDGTRVAYVYTDENREAHLHVRDVHDGGDRRIVTFLGQEVLADFNQHLTWAANGAIYLPRSAVLVTLAGDWRAPDLVAAATPAPTAVAECPPVDVREAVQLLDEVDSYRATYDVRFADMAFLSARLALAKSAGAAEVIVSRRDFGREFGVWDSSLEFESRLIMIGDLLYVQSADQSWTVARGLGAAGLFEAQSRIIKPELLDRLTEARCVGAGDTFDGTSAHHYRFEDVDVRGLSVWDRMPEGLRVSGAAVDIWTSTDDGHLLGFYVVMTTHLAGITMNPVAAFRVSDLNAPVTIEAPAGVVERPFPDDVPLTDDAIVLLTSDKTNVFASGLRPEAVLDQYKQQMVNLGWRLETIDERARSSMQESSAVTSGFRIVDILAYARDDRRLTISIMTDGQVTLVSMVIGE